MAVIFAGPADTAVTRPLLLTVAIPVAELLQVAVAVRSLVVLSLYVPVALSCRVFPTVIVPPGGVIAMDVSARGGGFTVMAAVAVCPPSLAVTFAEPGAIAVTSPALVTVATPEFEEAQVALAVTSVVERSL